MKEKWSLFNLVAIISGLSFLYLPIFLVVIFSFNSSRLVTVWGGFSTKWYSVLFGNRAFMDAAWVSLRVAFFSASVATFLGALAAMALMQKGSFRGHVFFSCLLFGPLMMPEVIAGLSFLLLFVALDMERGFYTLALSHITFSMSFVCVIVQSRLALLDRSLEEAAMDLGATPLQTFFNVTLPLLFPAIASGWLLAFTLSLDDLVIANFTSGPGATTLPMKIYSQVRLGVTPEINAACTILIIVVTFAILFASLINRRKFFQARQ